MARRGFGRGGGVPAPKRQIGNFAIGGDVDGLAIVAGTAKAQGSFGSVVNEAAVTIVRTRGQLLWSLVDNSGVRQIMHGAFGIIIVSGDAFSAGVASLPGPMSDSENDWYVWVPFTINTVDGTADDQAIGQTGRVNFDSRGMRKMKFGEINAPVVEVVSDVAAGGIDLSYVWRHQYKL